MLATLATGSRTIGALAEPYAMSFAAASKHVKKLEAAGLVKREIKGRTHVCHLDGETLKEAFEWMAHYERFWNARLEALEEALRQPDPEPHPDDTTATAGDKPSPDPKEKTDG